MNPDNRSGRYTLVGRIAEGQTIAHMDGPLRALANLLAANFEYPNPAWDKTRNPSIDVRAGVLRRRREARACLRH